MKPQSIDLSIRNRTILTCSHVLCDRPLHILCNNKETPIGHMFGIQIYPKKKLPQILCIVFSLEHLQSHSILGYNKTALVQTDAFTYK